MAFEEIQIASPSLEDPEHKVTFPGEKDYRRNVAQKVLVPLLRKMEHFSLSIHMSVYTFPRRTGDANPIGQGIGEVTFVAQERHWALKGPIVMWD